MNDPYEQVDQVDARFAILFAAFVLLLVAGLIVADVALVIIRPPALTSATVQPDRQPYDAGCTVMNDGTRICDMPVPKHQ